MSYLPHTNEEIKEMLTVIGAKDVEELFLSIPSDMRCDPELKIPAGMAEPDLWAHMNALAMKNRTLSCASSFLGAGAYRHYIPAAVSELSSRSEFVTPYTPYQPEISQGTLQAVFEYQSQICRLFGMDVSNASHYSAATACADAALMARRTQRGRTKIIVPENLNPQYREVLSTVFCKSNDLVFVPTPHGTIDRDTLKAKIGDDTAAVIVQFPNFFGIVEDMKDIADAAHNAKALLIAVIPEPISLGILTPPGTWGADIAVGEGLSLGLPVSFGGPTIGIFTVKENLVRQMPGRICGKTVDANGKPGYVLTLSTREQHIRREKATSNICSNQALCATTAGMYLAMVGKEGMRELAIINASKADYLKKKLAAIPNITIPFSAPTFNEFVIETKKPAKDVLAALAKDGVFGGADLGTWYPEMKNRILVCVTEMNTKKEMDDYLDRMEKHNAK